MNPHIKVLIVDDEPPARSKIKVFLSRDDRFEIVGEAGDGPSAVLAIANQKPDLVFLDIQMPGLSGFEVVEALGAEFLPAIIFTTAYDQYALKAFDIHAVDYLLKPFDEDRFCEALNRALDRLKPNAEVHHQIKALLGGVLPQGQNFLKRIMVRHGKKLTLIKVNSISRISSEEKYVRIFAGGETYLHRETMTGINARLDPGQFARIHRTEIINLEAVKELEPYARGDYVVLLKDGSRVTLSRNYRDAFFEILETRG